jgi:predicted RNase H-like nuclease (RuvC/YqgF family)
MSLAKFERVERWAKLLRDVGLILGVPTVIIIGSSLFREETQALKAHSEALKAQNDVLKETQYDRAFALIDSEKKLFLVEREELEKEIRGLRESGGEKVNEINNLRKQVSDVTEKIETLNSSRSLLESGNFRQEKIAYKFDFYEANFEERVSFHDTQFNQGATFEDANFLGDVTFLKAYFKRKLVFDEVDLRRATFNKADFSGVDLSTIIYDEHTTFPKQSLPRN